jgi:hypothetical protein
MTHKAGTPENAISRRDFLLSASLATDALGFESMTAMGASVQGDCKQLTFFRVGDSGNVHQ